MTGSSERRHSRALRGGAPPAPPASPRKARNARHAEDAATQQWGQEELAALLAAQGGPPGGWGTLPPLVLDKVFGHLEMRDLACAACVCSTWRYEAALDTRWRAFWQQQVSDGGLWRWAKADGGYRQQLRAKQLVRRGDCTATVFPFSRRDGPVTEVLFFDGGPAAADKRILTVQSPKVPDQCVRLHGSTLKVWDAAALAAQRPLLVVHDVLKHMQLEDGRLFLWRVAGDAVVVTSCTDPSDEAAAEEAAHWAEHPAIVASVLDPGPQPNPQLKDVPLEASFGRGVTPCEWLDMSNGLVAGSLMVPSQSRLIMRVFDLASGRCLRASSCAVPEDDNALNLNDHDVTMIACRSGDAHSLVAATCALFDSRVFLWRLPDAWVGAQRHAEQAPAPAGAPAAAAAGSSAGPAAHDQHQAARDAAWDPAAVPLAALPPPAAPGEAGAAQPPGAGQQQGQQGGVGYFEVRHVHSTAEQEPIVDISISTAASRIFIVGMENIFVADLSGVPYMRVCTLHWRGIVPPGQVMGPPDVGAFSWPLPHSTKTAFYLDATNSLFIAEFRRPQMSDIWYMGHGAASPAAAARRPRFDHHVASPAHPGALPQSYTLQSHTDLRQTPAAQLLSTQHGRAAGPRALEPGVVEYSQDGGVLITTGETACPAVAALLAAEKAAGTYLAGLGPGSGKPGGGARRGPTLVRGGRGQGRGKGCLAPRALVLIDTNSGCRYKAVPLEGAAESVHSAGQYLVAAVAELGPGYPDGLNGSIVVLDFSGQGFGVTEHEPASGATQQQKQQQKQQAKKRGGGDGSEEAEEQQQRQRGRRQQQQQQQKQQRGTSRQQGKTTATAKPGSGSRARRGAAAASQGDESGPSPKRGRR